MTILDGLKKLYVKLGGTIDSKHSYDDIGRLMEDVADVVNNSPGIPEVTSEDDGKVLKVIDGEWNKGTDDGLPEVTSADNDKIMKVINGVWGKSDFSVTVYKLTNTSYPKLPEGVTHTQIYDDIQAGKIILLMCNGKYYYPANMSYMGSSKKYDFACTAVDTRANFGVRVYVSYLEAITGGNNNSFTHLVTNNPNLPTAGSNIGKILSVISTGTYGLIDPPLPAVTTDDNGDVLGVVNGAWAKMDAPSGSNELILKGTISYDATDDSDIITFEDEVTYETITNALIAGKQPILELTEPEFPDHKYWARLVYHYGDTDPSYVFLCTVFNGGEMIYHTSIGKDYTKYYWSHYGL